MKHMILILAVATFGFSTHVTAQVVGPGNPAFQPHNPSLKALSDAIADAKKSNPELFVGLENIRANVAQYDRRKRGRFLPTSQHFTAMGPEFVAPLASVVWDEYLDPELSGTARTSFLVGAIESFATHQDGVVVPLLFVVLKHETDGLVLRAATEAIGRLGTDAEIIDLVGFSNSPDVRAGMRGCRRMTCARTLATFLDTASDSEARETIKALGSIANSWAWKTSEVQSKDDHGAVSGFVAQTLVAQFFLRPALRSQIRKSLMVVNHAETEALILKAIGSADEEAKKDAAQLIERLKNNPLNR